MLNRKNQSGAPVSTLTSSTIAQWPLGSRVAYPMKGRAAVASGVVTALIALCVSGCASSASSTTSSSAPNVALFAPPVSAVQLMEISTADDELVRACMAKHGFQYPTPRVTLSEFISGPANTNPLYTDIYDLRSQGYGIYQSVSVGSSDANTSPDPNAVYIKSLSPNLANQDEAVLFGTKTVTVTQPDGTTEQDGAAGGCFGAAETALYGSATKYLALSDYTANLLSDVATRATWAHSWQSALARWQKCMASQGFKYLNRDAAEADIAARYAVSGARISLVHKYELRVASRDAECVAQIGMNALAKREMADAAGTMTSLETGAVLAWNEMERRAASVAAKELANG
jgi:hypothetical protein